MVTNVVLVCGAVDAPVSRNQYACAELCAFYYAKTEVQLTVRQTSRNRSAKKDQKYLFWSLSDLERCRSAQQGIKKGNFL